MPLSIPFVWNVEINSLSGLGTVVVNGYLTGQVVATATVPEPSTIVLAAFGVVALLAYRRQRSLQSRA